MKHALLVLATLGALSATAAKAERLDIDHRIYAPLYAAMESPHDGTVFFQASPSGRVLDRILVAGTSAERDWSEALELVVIPRKGEQKTPQAWLAAFRPERESICPANLTPLGEDQNSVTFALESSACNAGTPLSGLYRVVYGRRSVYVVGAKYKGTMSPAQRAQWLAVLQSARLAG